MKKLCKSKDGEVIVEPRWPYRYVSISDYAYEKLVAAQRLLKNDEITIILTRGFENEGPLRHLLHFGARCCGFLLFCLLFPRRAGEARKIFSPNGHNHINRNCIDVGLAYRNQVLNLLPWGGFTTQKQLQAQYRLHRPVLDRVGAVLQACGFAVHPNPTEALQIHCEC